MNTPITRLRIIASPVGGDSQQLASILAGHGTDATWNDEQTLSCAAPALAASLQCRWPGDDGRTEATSADGRLRVLFNGYLLGEDPEESRRCARFILRAYEEYGDSCLARLNGWFSVVIADGRRERVLVAVDRFGFFPLYFLEHDDRIYLAGEARLLAELAGTRRRLDRQALAEYLAFDGVLGDRCLFDDVRRLPPSALWIFERGGLSRGTYYDVASVTKIETLPDDDALLDKIDETFARLLPRYFQRQPGLYMSLTGGWDTRAIVSYLKDPLPTYTYGAHPRTPDNVLAGKVADVIGVPHEVKVIGGSFFRDYRRLAEDVILATDGMGDVTYSHSMFILEQLPENLREVLTGKYGTQVVRGVASMAFDANLMYIFDALDPDLGRELKGLARTSHADAMARFPAEVGDDDRNLLFMLLEECRKVWSPNICLEKTRFQPLTPFVDNEMMEFLFRLPARWREGSLLQKSLIARRHSGLGKLPTNRGEIAIPSLAGNLSAKYYKALNFATLVCNSRKLPPRLRADRLYPAKMVTGRYRTWFRGELAEQVREVLLDPRSLERGLFPREHIERMVKEHQGRVMDRSNELRKMMNLELIHQLFIDS